MFKGISKDNPVIAWWSGGADSAVTLLNHNNKTLDYPHHLPFSPAR